MIPDPPPSSPVYKDVDYSPTPSPLFSPPTLAAADQILLLSHSTTPPTPAAAFFASPPLLSLTPIPLSFPSPSTRPSPAVRSRGGGEMQRRRILRIYDSCGGIYLRRWCSLLQGNGVAASHRQRPNFLPATRSGGTLASFPANKIWRHLGFLPARHPPPRHKATSTPRSATASFHGVACGELLS